MSPVSTMPLDPLAVISQQTNALTARVAPALRETADRAYSTTRRINHIVGKQLTELRQNWLLQQITQRLGANWLWDLLNTVDFKKVQATVEKTRRALPGVTNAIVSRRLVEQKLVYVGGLGFVSGVLPFNVPFIALDVVGTLRAQTELLYEIAYAYGLDLNDPARKAEVLWVLGLGLGSEQLISSGLKVFEKTAVPRLTPILLEQLARLISTQLAEKLVTRLVPVVGATLGAGANITFMYLLGQTAINFYERERQTPLGS
ncbi:EcsC family protein [Candidatus Cyanaurora vandensis]|uniref:EcsC family protein n=1 Tax=Candidatus Cyanaurora vandensis TaxID=2714958 RepID=UPI00257D5E70|nr:EcsC family protein [Candidatus Cyanaurora vandensis]